MKVIYSLFTHIFLRWLSLLFLFLFPPSLGLVILLRFNFWAPPVYSVLSAVIFITIHSFYGHAVFPLSVSQREFFCPQASFYSDIYFLSLSFCSSCYFCLCFSPLLYSYHFFFIIFFLSVSLSVLSFHLLSLSGFICRSCNITKARFAVSAITEKQITRMHNIIRQCTTLYIYVALYITHCVSAVALITQYSLSS